jgi:N-acetylglucosaminyldiphosphoundecaprenol N-acetyl-beta-D-mannosaminyltransferase
MYTKPSILVRRVRTTTMIDGVAFDVVTEDEVIAHVLSELEAGHGGYIVTPNVDILRRLRRSEYRHLADDADYVLADGMPVVWASRLQKTPLPSRVPGSSLILSLAHAAAKQQWSVFLLGGAEQAAEGAARRLAEEGVRVAGWHFPPFGFESDAAACSALVDALDAATPDIVYVGLGFPKQERLILQLREKFPHTWFLGCGGSLSFASGEVSRAPAVAQNLGLEWVYRLAQDPRRLARRYLVDDVPYTVGLLTRAALASVRHRRSMSERVELALSEPVAHRGAGRVITLPDRIGPAPGAKPRDDGDRRVNGDRRKQPRVTADQLGERNDGGVSRPVGEGDRFAV